MVRKAALIALALTSGCTSAAPKPDTDEAFQNIHIDALTKRLDRLESQVASLQPADSTVLLKRSGDGFSIFNSDIGHLTAQIVDISDQSGVARVKFQIGNPTSATITDLTMYALWGALDKDGNPTGEMHRYDFTTKSHIMPGAWTTVSIPVDGAKASDIGYVRITEGVVGSMTLAKQK